MQYETAPVNIKHVATIRLMDTLASIYLIEGKAVVFKSHIFDTLKFDHIKEAEEHIRSYSTHILTTSETPQ